VIGIGVDRESQTAIWFPGIDSFDKENAATECRVTNCAYSFVRKRSLVGRGETDGARTYQKTVRRDGRYLKRAGAASEGSAMAGIM
jgi:hypothetical protein